MTQQQMVQQQRMQQMPPSRKPFPWKRSLVLFAVGLVLIIVYFLPLVINALPLLKDFSRTLIPLLGAIAAFIGAIVPVIQVIFPPPSEPPAPAPVVTNTSVQQRNIPTVQYGLPPPAIQASKTAAFYFNEHLPTPEEFYGRMSERTTLINRVHHRGSVAIAGPRRIGKTWLVEYMKVVAPIHPDLGPTYRVGILSATHPHIQNTAGFTRKALEVLQVPTHTTTKTLTLAHLATAVQDLATQQIVPVLCIDECEGFTGKRGFDEHFFDGLRAMAQDDGLVLIFIGKEPLRDTVEQLTGKTSPLFNIMQQLVLKPFNQQDATSFVISKSQAVGFDEQERAFFLECATRHHHDGTTTWPPLRLQLTGQKLLQDKQGTGNGPHPYDIQNPLYRNDFKQRLDTDYNAVVNE